MSSGSDIPDDIPDIPPARLPRRSGREPFGLVEFPLAGLLAAIAWLEGEVVRIGRMRKMEARSGVAVSSRTDAGFVRTWRLVRRLVRGDAIYWRLAAWNRMVRAKRAVLEDDAARGGLLERLGGVAACERWERRAAGLAAWAGRQKREARPEWYWALKARERAAAAERAEARAESALPDAGHPESHIKDAHTNDAPSPGLSRGRLRLAMPTAAPGRARGQGALGSVFTLPALPPATRKSYPARGGTRGVSPSLEDAPIPVWPCELLEAEVHGAMMERVRAAVAEKDRELAAQRQAQRAASGRAPGRDVPVRDVRATARDADARIAGWKPP